MNQITDIIKAAISKIDDKDVYEHIEYSIYKASTTTKQTGDKFETLSVLFLKSLYPVVWLQKEIPNDIKTLLNLPSKDMGIDIVCQTTDNQYVAVQCKFRRPSKSKDILHHAVTKTQLATFHELTKETGPWITKILMTNAPVVFDKSEMIIYDKQFFKQITRIKWIEILKNVKTE